MKASTKLFCSALVAACAAFGAWAGDDAATFSTPGPDKYADGTKVLKGECYALVWTADGAKFPGVTWDFKAADTNIAEVVKVLAQANDSSACPVTEITGEREDGTYEVVLLDTRVPTANNVLSGLAGGIPVLVSAWTLIDDEGNQEGWKTVKIAATEASFAFDVSANVADGYAVVYDISMHPGLYTVYPLPIAYVETDATPEKVQGSYDKLRWPETTIFDEESFKLNASYTFNAYEVSGDAKAAFDLFFANHAIFFPGVSKNNFDKKNLIPGAREAAKAAYPGMEAMVDKVFDWYDTVYPFFNWNADFVATFDQPVAADSVVLVGRYDEASQYGYDSWVCSSARALSAGEEFRLLTDNEKKKVYVAYHEICTRVKQFKCGVINNSKDNWGKTMTVKLNLYPNIAGSYEDDNMTRFTVGTYKYRFDGPLNIVYQLGEGAPDGAVVPPEYHGVGYEKAQQLPKPTYTSDTMMFAGWTTNGVPFTYIPANFFAEENAPLILTATWSKADKVDVQVEDTKSKINVTEDWVTNNVEIAQTATPEERKAAIEEELDKPDENGLKKWVNYVIGQDPETAIEVTDTKSGDEQSIPIVSNLQAPAPDSGFKVQYSIDKIEEEGGVTEVIIEGEPQDTSDLIIDLNDKNNADPTGYYKMNVIVTPENNSETNKVVAETTIGVLKVESAQSPLIVAVPWTSLESSTNITVSKVVKTSTLSEGDTLYIYCDADQGTEVGEKDRYYYAWEVENGKWKSMWVQNKTTHMPELSPDPDTWTIPRGVGMWLERADVSKPFYLSGLYNKTEAASVIEPPAEEEPDVPAYNLIAPPSIEPTDLNNPEQVKYSGGIDPDDQIMVVGGTVPKYYSYKNGKWGYYKKVYKTVGKKTVGTQVWVEDDAVIPAGTGAWYVSGGGSPTITWNPTAEEK